MAKITTDKSGVEAMVASMTKQIEQMDIQAIAAAAKKTQDGLAINSYVWPTYNWHAHIYFLVIV